MRVFIKFILATSLISLSSQSYAQRFYVRSHLGAMFYQGDLAPRPFSASFGPGNMSAGLSVGYTVNDWLAINTNYLHGKLSGDDRFSDDENKKSRNLDFRSFIHDASITGEIKINKFWKSLDKYNLKLNITGGIGMVFFDPETLFKGEWVRLQPLATEGQLLATSTKGLYKLHSITRPIGANVEFSLSKRVSFGIEMTTVKTYTDYIDDVSTTYPDYYQMFESGNELGAVLTNRQGELIGQSFINAAGKPRGNSNKNDSYLMTGLYIKVAIGKSSPTSVSYTTPLQISQ